jgi:probable HAF family extracellular repeat protein
MTDLGDLPGGGGSLAWGINDAGQVVGESTAATGNRAFLWQGGSGITDLNDLIDPGLGWTLTRARAINARGQIVGTGFFNGAPRAYLLTPVAQPAVIPVPAALPLLAGALGALAFFRRRRPARTAA